MFIIYVFWILIFIAFVAISLVLKVFGISFIKSMTWFTVFFFSFKILYTITGYSLMGERHGSFFDTFFIEVKNGYMLDFIDDITKAELTKNSNNIVEVLDTRPSIAIHGNCILVLNPNNFEELLVIDTINNKVDTLNKPWHLKDRTTIDSKELMKVSDFYEKLVQERWKYTVEYIIVIFLSLFIASYITGLYAKTINKIKEQFH